MNAVDFGGVRACCRDDRSLAQRGTIMIYSRHNVNSEGNSSSYALKSQASKGSSRYEVFISLRTLQSIKTSHVDCMRNKVNRYGSLFVEPSTNAPFNASAKYCFEGKGRTDVLGRKYFQRQSSHRQTLDC